MNDGHQKNSKSVAVVIAMVLSLAAAVAHADVLYITEPTRIAKISPSGAVSTFVSRTNTNGLNRPSGLTMDSHANLYGSNDADNNLFMVTPDGVASLFASGNDGPPYLNEPYSLAVDSHDNIYAANFVGGLVGTDVLKFAPDGTRSLFATGFNRASGIAVDGSGNVYVSNYGDNTISKVTPGGVVSTYATGLNQPGGLAIDLAGNLFEADFGSNSIFKISGGIKSTFAILASAPNALAFDSAGSLFATIGGNAIDLITPGGVISTFATGLSFPEAIVAQVPEPSALILLGLGGFAFIGRRRRKIKRGTREGMEGHGEQKT